MKKLVVYSCVGALVLSLTACGGNDVQEDAQNGTTQTTEQTTENTAENTDAAQETTQENTGAEGGAQNGVSGEGTESQVSAWSEEMEGIKTAVINALGDKYWPDMQITAEMLEATFGITPNMYDDYMGEMPMMSTNVDTLLIIKTKDDKVDAVEETLNAYRENKVNDTMQYPMNVGKIQASRIERIGNYVCFVQLGADTTEALEQGDEAVIAQCQEQNELVIEIIGRNIQQ